MVLAVRQSEKQSETMLTTTASQLPELCLQEGLDCTSCTASTARELARACPGLPAKLVAQLFVQIHTNVACSRMHRNFLGTYEDEMAASRTNEIRKPAGFRPIAAAAAA